MAVDFSRFADVLKSLGVSGEVRELPEPAIGGVGPVAHPAPIRTLVGTWLSRYDVVWAAAGHPHTVFPTSSTELLRVTGGTPADVGD
jgi:prolyl-tRNA editing enzyme YbaK/EbsC (Cys-tRNA(Pro) deacylase)